MICSVPVEEPLHRPVVEICNPLLRLSCIETRLQSCGTGSKTLERLPSVKGSPSCAPERSLRSDVKRSATLAVASLEVETTILFKGVPSWIFVLLSWISVVVPALLLFSLASFIAFIVLYGNFIGDTFMELGRDPLRGNPGYMPDFFCSNCLHVRDQFASVLVRLEAFNNKAGWINVTFPSRGGRSVGAMYFPCVGGQFARVVISYASSASALHNSVQTAVHFLRTMNVSALAPDLQRTDWRAYVAEWHEQASDLLGAWDYAVSDPHGLLGGPLSTNSVGLLGFEFGGFVVQSAFALEPRVHAILLDGAMYDVIGLARTRVESPNPVYCGRVCPIMHAMHSTFVGVVKDLLEQQMWSRCEYRAQQRRVKANSLTYPLLNATSRSSAGYIGIIHSANDMFIPVAQPQNMVRALSNAHLAGTEVSMEWYPMFDSGSSGDSCRLKRELHLDLPIEYQTRFCMFWSNAFLHKRPLDYRRSLCAHAAAIAIGTLP